MKQIIHRPPVNFDGDPRPRRQAARQIDPVTIEENIRRADRTRPDEVPATLAARRPFAASPVQKIAKPKQAPGSPDRKTSPTVRNAATKPNATRSHTAAKPSARHVKLPTTSRGAFLLRLPPALDSRLRAFAERSGLSVNSIVCAAVAFYINGKS